MSHHVWWSKMKKKNNQFFFSFFHFFLQPCNFLYGISTLKGFLRQKAILTTHMHYILSKKHDLNDFGKNRKCPHGNAVWPPPLDSSLNTVTLRSM